MIKEYIKKGKINEGRAEMNKFVQDLQYASNAAAKELRKNVESDEEERRHREQRQEAQLVAEVYCILRGDGYSSKELFMEYLYTPITVNGIERKLKPDLIYEKDGADDVVEFRVFWEGDLYKNSSSINGTAQGIVQTYFEKIKLYPGLPHRIASVSLVLAYVGPEKISDTTTFDFKEFSDTIHESIKKDFKSEVKKVPIKAIVS